MLDRTPLIPHPVSGALPLGPRQGVLPVLMAKCQCRNGVMSGPKLFLLASGHFLLDY